MSIVRNNLLTRPGYSPYCGNMLAAADPGGCSNPRTRFNGQQFKCHECGWESQFEPEFIQQYKEARSARNQATATENR